jgi:hypothetical protein
MLAYGKLGIRINFEKKYAKIFITILIEPKSWKAFLCYYLLPTNLPAPSRFSLKWFELRQSSLENLLPRR